MFAVPVPRLWVLYWRFCIAIPQLVRWVPDVKTTSPPRLPPPGNPTSRSCILSFAGEHHSARVYRSHSEQSNVGGFAGMLRATFCRPVLTYFLDLFSPQRNQLEFIKTHITGNDPVVTKLDWFIYKVTAEVVMALATALKVRDVPKRCIARLCRSLGYPLPPVTLSHTLPWRLWPTGQQNPDVAEPAVE